ncbi:hypothetical protein JMJ35_001981 [Cladonia borealis]|uniref:Uncharacterized protein n=1 Tax=Cladonia borealis TaxID=184061 RepID=A0AA39R6S1_9LECA|nr:hypothetical protein JMJ35_001981 [Cladonia borealis]
MAYALLKRQFNGDDGDGLDDGWGYSNTAIAIKWAVVGAIILIFLLWFVGGYYHAQRRIKKGLPPLGYHRFLLPRRQRAQFMPRPQYGYYPQQQNRYPNGDGYQMHNYPAPPPAYNNTEHIPPPVYQPPEHGSKVNPVQDWAAPPAGPPPANVNGGEASSAMQNVPLNPSTEVQEDVAPDSPIQPPRRGIFSRLNPFSK